MNRTWMIAGIVVAGIAGYLLEPVLVTSPKNAATKNTEEETLRTENPQTSPAPESTPPSEEEAAPATPEPQQTPSPEPESAENVTPEETESVPAAAPPAKPDSTPAEPEPSTPEPLAPDESQSPSTESQEATPEPESAPEGDEALLAEMKRSFESGTYKEFGSKPATAYKLTGVETIEGVEYHTGLVAYVADTVFGPESAQAKALIKDGTVLKWVSPKTGMEIK